MSIQRNILSRPLETPAPSCPSQALCCIVNAIQRLWNKIAAIFHALYSIVTCCCRSRPAEILAPPQTLTQIEVLRNRTAESLSAAAAFKHWLIDAIASDTFYEEIPHMQRSRNPNTARFAHFASQLIANDARDLRALASLSLTYSQDRMLGEALLSGNLTRLIRFLKGEQS